MAFKFFVISISAVCSSAIQRDLTYRHPAAHSQGAGCELHQVSLEIEDMPKRVAISLRKSLVKN
jgi:hypothetical protein